MSVNSICLIPDCNNPIESGRNVCGMHRSRFKKYKSYDKPIVVQQETCFVEGCERPRARKPDGRFKGRRCVMHRDRWETYRSEELPDRTKPTEGIVKTCSVHGDLQINDVFIARSGKHKNSRYKQGYIFYQCKQCQKEKHKIYSNANKSKIKSTDLLRTYGITIEQYNEMLEDQNNRCGICGNEETSKIKGITKSLSVDHCHTNGNVRQLLCSSCNYGLGNFKDSVEILEKAILYIKKWGQ